MSFWRLSRDPRLVEKAKRATAHAEEALGITLPEEGDAFLGWRDDEGARRFCHDFSDAEVDEMSRFAEKMEARIVDDFNADGRTGDLNRYLILERL